MKKKAKKTVPAKKSSTAKKKMTMKASSKKSKSTVKSSPKKSSGDIVNLILEDHKALKALIKVMKNGDLDLETRKNAYDEFVPLLTTHAKPEEMALYTFMKDNEELREDAFEGDVEHQLADQMAEEAEREEDEDKFSAQIKVLAELVEHHIEEEEDELLPHFRGATTIDERVELGNKFLDLKARMLSEGSDDSPSESSLKEKSSKESGDLNDLSSEEATQH